MDGGGALSVFFSFLFFLQRDKTNKILPAYLIDLRKRPCRMHHACWVLLKNIRQSHLSGPALPGASEERRGGGKKERKKPLLQVI